MTSADSCRMGGIENVETVEAGPDSVLMPMCGSAGGRGDLWGMGYHGDILLKSNMGEGEAEIEGLI